MTIEEFEQVNEEYEVFGDNPYRGKDIDNNMMVVNLLREKIPYDKCNRILSAAEHDIIYLCNIDEMLPYLTKEDYLKVLQLGAHYDDDLGCLAMYV